MIPWFYDSNDISKGPELDWIWTVMSLMPPLQLLLPNHLHVLHGDLLPGSAVDWARNSPHNKIQAQKQEAKWEIHT